ncbi:MAG: DUF2267 domain-containing protein [Spirulinaceae cyanobacterium]
MDSEEIDFRVANTLGASDGPLPHLIRFKQAQLTDKGQKILKEMSQNPPESLEKGPSTLMATQNTPFLEKIMLRGELEDIYDARDMATVVYRTMRDMMTTEAAGKVASELNKEIEPTADKTLQKEISELWQDENPLVSWLSKIRPPLKINEDTFIFRVEQEGGMPKGTDGEKVIKAVFAATKDELSSERVAEISDFLPGKIKQMWQQA